MTNNHVFNFGFDVMCIIIIVFFMIGNITTIFGLDTGFFAGIPHTFVNGVYKSICNEMCFDLNENSATKGYDPQFLALPMVKITCIDAKDYGKMGYCDKSFGTL